MSHELRLTLAQIEIQPDINQNLRKIISVVRESKDEVILFPELSLTGYQDLRRIPHQSIQDALSEIQRYAGPKHVFLGAPYVGEDITNAYFCISEREKLIVAEKDLLFPGLDDIAGLSRGIRRETIEIKGVKVGTLICFELRSPELARAMINEAISLLLVPVQWPKARIDHFQTLLKARAIENQIYVIGINGVGAIGETILGGGSCLFNPRGEPIFSLGEDEEVLSIKLNIEEPSLPYPLKTPLPSYQKVKSLDELMEISQHRRKRGQIMVFTNGCFDILHAGHIDYLKRARSLGDFLVVGLNSDASIRKIKGRERPINSQEMRIEVLAGLATVDYVVVFEDETPERLIRALKPDVLVKGEDWEEDKIIGADFVRSHGGRVERIKFTYSTSTSNIIQKIKALS
ncbi:MAG: D-glycero-beta-D-manno-heptose 1-phosphate adenylyltransferase [Caldimicrobium sp.]|nr:D-glycero-beta-D-manno-heptose 1-phosphate adenylyltransferase [Caldimicrobium sp.]